MNWHRLSCSLFAATTLIVLADPSAYAYGKYSRQYPKAQRSAPSREELRLRMMLLQRSMGFGGIFAPIINGMRRGKGPTQRGNSANECGRYTEFAACQAHKAGDDWAADRLQDHRSEPSEFDWYNR